MKVETKSKYHKGSKQTKGSVSQIFQKVFQKFGKTPEIAIRQYLKQILEKIPDVQYLF